ncbi:hypothetical protein ACROYT_G034175 [Oculina patagonica]
MQMHIELKASQQLPVITRNDLTALTYRDVAEIFLLVTRVNSALVVEEEEKARPRLETIAKPSSTMDTKFYLCLLVIMLTAITVQGACAESEMKNLVKRSTPQCQDPAICVPVRYTCHHRRPVDCSSRYSCSAGTSGARRCCCPRE